jgi:hypothetical protein
VLVFYYINDDVEVDNKVFQLMRCHVCYYNQITITNSRTQLRKGIISYFKNNGITTFKKHVDVDHVVLAKTFEEELHNFGKVIITKKLIKKRPNIFTSSISSFFGSTILSKKDEPQQKEFLEDLTLLII